MKYTTIVRVFEDWDKLKQEGIFLSGIKGEGEYKIWYTNNQLWVHSFWEDMQFHGEFKTYGISGKLITHRKYEKGLKVKDYL